MPPAIETRPAVTIHTPLDRDEAKSVEKIAEGERLARTDDHRLLLRGRGMKVVELYGRVRYAVQIEGLSRREAARQFGIDPRTVAKMLAFSVPPGYRRSRPPARPKLDPFTGIIDGILAADEGRRRKRARLLWRDHHRPDEASATSNRPGAPWDEQANKINAISLKFLQVRQVVAVIKHVRHGGGLRAVPRAANQKRCRFRDW
jgi:hypothetical protein